MKKTLAAMAMVVAALSMAVAPAAAATTSSQRFTIFGSDNGQTVIATGAFVAVGSANTVDDDNDTFVFPNGTFNVFHPQTGGTENFNETACLGTATFNGTYTLSGGTGAYAGISGSGTYSGKAIFVAERTGTGCSEEGGSSWFFVTATGTTTLP